MKTLLSFFLFITPLACENPYNERVAALNKFFFKGKQNGFFIDVGANDGVIQSNTLFFEKNCNWTGLCLEPIPKVFKKLEKNRSCTCLKIALSAAKKKEKFIACNLSLISGLKKNYNNQHKKRWEINKKLKEKSAKIITVQCDLFNNIAKKHKIKEVDLLDIDTEGSEFEILQSIDFSQTYIHVILVENHYNGDKIRNFLKKHNFSYKFKLYNDEFYVNNTSKYANSHL